MHELTRTSMLLRFVCYRRVQLEPSLLSSHHCDPMTAQGKESSQLVKPPGPANWSSQPVAPTGQAKRSSQPVEPTGQANCSSWSIKANTLIRQVYKCKARNITWSLDNRNLPGHNITSHCGLPNIYNSIFISKCSQPCIVLWSKHVQTRCCTKVVAQSRKALMQTAKNAKQHFGAPFCINKTGLPKQTTPCKASCAPTKAYSPAPKSPTF